MSNLSPKLQNDIVIKILVDNYDGQIENQIELINGKYRKSLIQLGYSNRLGQFDEMIICFDGKYVLQIQEDLNNNLKGSFTNESNKVLIQEILFEKCWN